MLASIIDDLQQPEYIHVLINPLPVYGLAMGALALFVALIYRTRSACVAALVVVLISAASAWPVYYYGEAGYDRVSAMADRAGDKWLDAHKERGEKLIYLFYALAFLTIAALLAPIKRPRAAVPLAIAVLLGTVACLGAGGWIAYAGGKVRHKEFRNSPPPEAK